MSVYHNSFSYLGKNSKTDFNFLVTHFADNSDSGEIETFLSTSAVYSDSYDGSRQKFYGAKYDAVAEVQITVIKQDGTDLGIDDNRKALRWLTGSRQATWMDFYIDDVSKYRLLGRVKNVTQYKLDARVVGLVITFESVSPYGYSSLQTFSQTFNGSTRVTIPCDSDDLYSYVYMNTTFNNSTGDSLTITNSTTGDTTEVTGLGSNEMITISDNMVITTDNPAKSFGNNFNFVFPRLAAGDNDLTLSGNGSIKFEYIYPIKLGNIAIDINSVSDPICDEEGNIQLDTLDWSRISNTPTTMYGYGISSDVAEHYYNKSEINGMLENFSPADTYTKSQIDSKINTVNTSISNVKTDLSNNYYKKSDVDAAIKAYKPDLSNYATKTEVSNNLSNNYYNKSYIDDEYYTKKDIDDIVANLEYDPSEGVPTTLSWAQVTDKPNTLEGYELSEDVSEKYYNKSEVETIINDAVGNINTTIEIDEDEFNAMLEEVFA